MYIIGGSIFVFFGCVIILNPRFYDRLWSHYWDFTDIKWLYGIVFIIIGIVFICYAWAKKAKDFEGKFLICTKCEETFEEKDAPSYQCPKCNAKLEDMEGFYERHPELHDGEKSLNN